MNYKLCLLISSIFFVFANIQIFFVKKEIIKFFLSIKYKHFQTI